MAKNANAGPKRRAGDPVPSRLQKTIVKRLKDGESVSAVARATGLMWKTVDRVRHQAGIPPRKSGVNDARYDQATLDRVLERLKDPERPGEDTIAREEGVSKSVVRRIREQAGIASRTPSVAAPPLDSSAGTRDRIQREDEIKRLRKEIKQLHRDDLNNDAYRSILGRMAGAPESPPRWIREPAKHRGVTAECPVAIWADWHLGEVVRKSEIYHLNEYSPTIADRRIRSLVQSTIRLCRDHHNPNLYPGLVLNLGGDFVSGALHPELAKTDAESRIESALHGRDILIWAIDALLEHFKRIYIACCAGNHARDSAKPEYKRYVRNSFDWLIYQLLARHYEGRGEIVIDIPDENEVYYRVFNQRYLLMHGDMMGVKGGDGIIGSLGPIARGEVKVGRQASTIGRDFDRLLMGHWHQEITLPRVTVANTLKGFDEFAKNALRAPPSTPSQPLWFVHPQRPQTSYWNVTVEDPKDATVNEWVSWPKAA